MKKLEDKSRLKVTEDIVGIVGPSLEAVPLGDVPPACYPQVALRVGGSETEHQIGVVWLENRFLRVGVAPGLGGRIVAIEEVQTGEEIVKFPEKLDVVPGGNRGVEGRFGIEFLAGRERINRLGHVDYRIKDTTGPEDAVAIFLHEWVGAISWHGVITLPPDRAAIVIEQKVQNRDWRSQELRSGLKIWEGDGDLAVIDADGAFGFVDQGEFATMPEDGRLGGRRIDQWRVELVVHRGVGEQKSSGRAASVGIKGTELRVKAHEQVTGGKVFLHVDGQTLEAPLDLDAGETSSTDLGAMAAKVDGIVLRDGLREVVLQWPAPLMRERSAISFPHELFDQLIDSPLTEVEMSRVPGLEARGWEKSALAHIQSGDWEKADEAMEKYLGYHAEDGLGWWLKASLQRESGREREDDDRELPNAHYLIPLEPVLKAEAFLNTPQAQGAEANPLLSSIAADPGVAAGVVALYYEKGLWKGMTRLADELLRHRPNAMIHYLLAAALIKNRTMETTAAEHIAMAERLAIEPPFPYRLVELGAVAILLERFPGSERLRQIGAVMESARLAGLI